MTRTELAIKTAIERSHRLQVTIHLFASDLEWDKIPAIMFDLGSTHETRYDDDIEFSGQGWKVYVVK